MIIILCGIILVYYNDNSLHTDINWINNRNNNSEDFTISSVKGKIKLVEHVRVVYGYAAKAWIKLYPDDTGVRWKKATSETYV